MPGTESCSGCVCQMDKPRDTLTFLLLFRVTVAYKVSEPAQTGKNSLSSESSLYNSAATLSTGQLHFLRPLRGGPSCQMEQSERGFLMWTRLPHSVNWGPWAERAQESGAGRAVEPNPLPGLCTTERLQTAWAPGQTAGFQWES